MKWRIGEREGVSQLDFLYSAISACQTLPSPELFSFLRKKVCCMFGGNGILFYFCTRFPTLRRLVELEKS
ncbi:hypothetical protein, partial [Alloprevotella tannerae]